MSLSCGIVGAPNAGKSTLFQLLTSIPVEIAPYPFSTVNPNRGLVPIQDDRLEQLAYTVGSSKTTFASLQVVDVAGLVKGASQGEGLGNQFLAQLREMDLLIHVLGEFSLTGEGKEPPESMVDQARDVNVELILADLETVEKRISKTAKVARLGDRGAKKEQEFLERLKNHLDKEKPARTFIPASGEEHFMEELHLLTNKQVLYVLNRDEDSMNEEVSVVIKNYVESQKAPWLSISCKLEQELRELNEEEREAFQEEFSLTKDMVKVIVDRCYELLQLITFFTIKGEEARAWLIQKGTTAWQAAGKIHTDMQTGFRGVEVINWEELVKAGGMARARETGSSRAEGKDYQVKEGEVLLIRFSA